MRTLVPFLVLDVAFQVLVYVGFVFAAGTRASVAGRAPADVMVLVGGVTSAIWFTGVAWHLRDVDRRVRAAPSAPDAELSAVARVVSRLALALAVTWATKWVLQWTLFAVLAGDPDSRAAQLSLVLATFVGPGVLGHALATVVSVAERRTIGGLLGARGLPAPNVPSLQLRLAVYGLGLSAAPSFYAGVVALSPAPPSAKLVMLPIFALTICSWGAICAVLVTTSITARLRPLSAAIRAITEAGSVRDVPQLPVERNDELGAIVFATNSMVARLSETEGSRDRASAKLEALTHELENQVAERTEEIRLVMQTIAEMYFCVDARGVLVGTRSLETERRFGVPGPDERVWSYIGKDDPHVAGLLETVWSDLESGLLAPELFLAQLPKELRAGDATLEMDLRLLRRPSGDLRVVVVLRDVTAEHTEAVQRDVSALIAHLAHDRDGVLDFIGEICRLREDLVTGRGHPRRTIHTIKGNAAIFGLNTVARTCQEVENDLEGDEPTRAEVARIHNALEIVLVHVQSVIDATSRTIVVDAREVDSLLLAVDSGASRDTLAERLRALRYEPLSKPLDRAARAARALAKRLEKGPIETRVDADEIRVEPEAWQSLFASFAHVVRNAVDHGLESPTERAEAGKPRAGRIVFSAHAEGDRIVLSISDDGRGIDWDSVRERARAVGLPHETREDLVEAVFCDGFSTRAVATDISGRGVGMSALREAAERLGAEVRVESEKGLGTTISVVVPNGASGASGASGADGASGARGAPSSATRVRVEPPAGGAATGT